MLRDSNPTWSTGCCKRLAEPCSIRTGPGPSGILSGAPGAFAGLEPAQQSAILREHATIGRAYGEADLAHDVRLACHGLDKNDNDFVIGLVGRDLHPLSHIVQTMRKTRQTSQYIESLGPFFIGRTVWQSPLPSSE